MGGARWDHATIVLDHPDKENDNNNKKQTGVVLGGWQQGQGHVNSVIVLNLEESNKQWREGPPMNKKRRGHAAVVCNGSVYVMGGYKIEGGYLDCIEQIDVSELLQSSFTNSNTHASNWTTLTCRLSTQRWGCCAVAVLNRYIVVMGGRRSVQYLSSIEIIDTRHHAVIAGPSMTVPRQFCASAVIGHRIFVVGGGDNEHDNFDSVEYLDFAMDDNLTTAISFSSAWTIHPDLVRSDHRSSCTVVTVGSCLVVPGGRGNLSVEVLDTHHNRVWNLPPFVDYRSGCSMVTVANHVAVIGGWDNPTCATLPLIAKNTWCFRRLCEQQPNGWYHFREAVAVRPSTLTSKSE